MHVSARRIACAVLFAAALPVGAAASPEGDYMVARDRAIAASIAAHKAGKGADEAVVARDEAALKDLGKRMFSLVAPVKVKGLGSPAYTLQMFIFGDDEPVRQLDGIAVHDKDNSTRVVITPEAVLQKWIATRAGDKGAPAALRQGIAEAAATDYFYNHAVIDSAGGYTPYLTLPVTPGPGEAAYATLGLFSDDVPGNTLPNRITIVRVIPGGRALVGIAPAKLALKPLPACDAVWKPYKARFDALNAAISKDNKTDDPRVAEATKIADEGSAAYRACFAKEAQTQPFLAAAVRKAEAFLQTTRGN